MEEKGSFDDSDYQYTSANSKNDINITCQDIPKITYSLNLNLSSKPEDRFSELNLEKSNIQYIIINEDNTFESNSKTPWTLLNSLRQNLSKSEVGARSKNKCGCICRCNLMSLPKHMHDSTDYSYSNFKNGACITDSTKILKNLDLSLSSNDEEIEDNIHSHPGQVYCIKKTSKVDVKKRSPDDNGKFNRHIPDSHNKAQISKSNIPEHEFSEKIFISTKTGYLFEDSLQTRMYTKELSNSFEKQIDSASKRKLNSQNKNERNFPDNTFQMRSDEEESIEPQIKKSHIHSMPLNKTGLWENKTNIQENQSGISKNNLWLCDTTQNLKSNIESNITSVNCSNDYRKKISKKYPHISNQEMNIQEKLKNEKRLLNIDNSKIELKIRYKDQQQREYEENSTHFNHHLAIDIENHIDSNKILNQHIKLKKKRKEKAIHRKNEKQIGDIINEELEKIDNMEKSLCKDTSAYIFTSNVNYSCGIDENLDNIKRELKNKFNEMEHKENLQCSEKITSHIQDSISDIQSKMVSKNSSTHYKTQKQSFEEHTHKNKEEINFQENIQLNNEEGSFNKNVHKKKNKKKDKHQQLGEEKENLYFNTNNASEEIKRQTPEVKNDISSFNSSIDYKRLKKRNREKQVEVNGQRQIKSISRIKFQERDNDIKKVVNENDFHNSKVSSNKKASQNLEDDDRHKTYKVMVHQDSLLLSKEGTSSTKQPNSDIENHIAPFNSSNDDEKQKDRSEKHTQKRDKNRIVKERKLNEIESMSKEKSKEQNKKAQQPESEDNFSNSKDEMQNHNSFSEKMISSRQHKIGQYTELQMKKDNENYLKTKWKKMRSNIDLNLEIGAEEKRNICFEETLSKTDEKIKSCPFSNNLDNNYENKEIENINFKNKCDPVKKYEKSTKAEEEIFRKQPLDSDMEHTVVSDDHQKKKQKFVNVTQVNRREKKDQFKRLTEKSSLNVNVSKEILSKEVEHLDKPWSEENLIHLKSKSNWVKNRNETNIAAIERMKAELLSSKINFLYSNKKRKTKKQFSEILKSSSNLKSRRGDNFHSYNKNISEDFTYNRATFVVEHNLENRNCDVLSNTSSTVSEEVGHVMSTDNHYAAIFGDHLHIQKIIPPVVPEDFEDINHESFPKDTHATMNSNDYVKIVSASSKKSSVESDKSMMLLNDEERQSNRSIDIGFNGRNHNDNKKKNISDSQESDDCGKKNQKDLRTHSGTADSSTSIEKYYSRQIFKEKRNINVGCSESKEFNGDPKILNKRGNSSEIFVENNLIPVTEINLDCLDEDLELVDYVKNSEQNFCHYWSSTLACSSLVNQGQLLMPRTRVGSINCNKNEYSEYNQKNSSTSSIDNKIEELRSLEESNGNIVTEVVQDKNIEIQNQMNKSETDVPDIFTGIFIKSENSNSTSISFKSVDNTSFIDKDEYEVEYVKPNPEILFYNSKEESLEVDTDLINDRKELSFADILSQSNANEVQKKFDKILAKSALSNKSTDFSREKNSNSEPNYGHIMSFDYLNIDDNSERDSKGAIINNHVTQNEQLNEKEKKTKVLELLKQSKSILEIEDELNLTTGFEQLKESVKDLHIDDNFPVPLMHRIAYYTNNTPNKMQRRELEAAGLTPKLGRFSKDEDEQIKKNWMKFCKLHNWDETNYQPFLKASKKSKHGVLTHEQVLKFVKFISQGFDYRLMYSVYLRFQRLFSQNGDNLSRFTEEEDKIILRYVKKGGSTKPFIDLSEVLKRSRSSIRLRYQLLRERKKMGNKLIRWDKQLTEELLAHLIEVTCSIDLSELKDRTITPQEWRAISKRMNIPARKLRRAWTVELYARFFTDQYLKKILQVKTELIDFIFVRYKDWREINWKEVAKELDTDLAHEKLRKTFKDLILKRVPKNLHNNLHKSLKYVKEHFEDNKRTTFDKMNFVRDILKETRNGTIIPKIEHIGEEEVTEGEDQN